MSAASSIKSHLSVFTGRPGNCSSEIHLLTHRESPTVSALWIADLLQAVHMDASLNFSTQEIDIYMPRSSARLQDCYARLLKGEPRPSDAANTEDAMVLLMALLSDTLYLQRSLSRVAAPDPMNPFVPLSPHSEHERMHNVLFSALDTWLETFQRDERGIMVFYHYCCLYLAFPQVSGLASHACYPTGHEITEPKVPVSDTAVTHAWAILDNVAAGEINMSETMEPLWFPVAIYHAGLTIWAQTCGSRLAHASSTRILLPFIVEVQKFRWPCSAAMASSLQMLMAADRKR
jgi:hypothetical protein